MINADQLQHGGGIYLKRREHNYVWTYLGHTHGAYVNIDIVRIQGVRTFLGTTQKVCTHIGATQVNVDREDTQLYSQLSFTHQCMNIYGLRPIIVYYCVALN